jgi:hypothetical protein
MGETWLRVSLICLLFAGHVYAVNKLTKAGGETHLAPSLFVETGRGSTPPEGGPPHMHLAGVQKTLSQMDKNGDGSVSLDEFEQHLQSKDVSEYFNLVDQNHDGKLSVDEAALASEAEKTLESRETSFLSGFYKKARDRKPTNKGKNTKHSAPPTQSQPSSFLQLASDAKVGCCSNFRNNGCFRSEDTYLSEMGYAGTNDGCCWPSSRGLWCRTSPLCTWGGCPWTWLSAFSYTSPCCAMHNDIEGTCHGWTNANMCEACSSATWTFKCTSVGIQYNCGYQTWLECADPDISTGAKANAGGPVSCTNWVN